MALFFKNEIVFTLPQDTAMNAWLATARSGDSGQTRAPAAAREQDERQQSKDAASCYFTDHSGLKSKLFITADKMRAGGEM